MASKEKYKNTGVYLRVLYDDLVLNLHQRLDEAGYGEITPSHGLVFQYLEDNGSRITDLAAHAGMTKQSMSALVYQLEEYGYLKRKNDPLDARAVLGCLGLSAGHPDCASTIPRMHQAFVRVRVNDAPPRGRT